MKDKLSALLDGDLDERMTGAVLDAVRRDRSLRTDWDAYCAIGDVIRGERLDRPDFVGRVMAGIESEPTLLAPSRTGNATALQEAAWRKFMPVAASVMGVAAVGLVANTLYSEPESVAQVAAAPRIPVTAGVPVSVRPAPPPASIDPHREYLFAHQAMAGGGPISGAIRHVRTVSDVRQDSAR